MSIAFDNLTPIVYISPDGDDDVGDGSYENPWQSMSKAGTSTKDGAIIGVKNGEYEIQTPTPNRIWVGESRGGVFFDDHETTLTNFRVFLTSSNLPNTFINIGWRNIIATTGVNASPTFSTQGSGGVYFKYCVFKNVSAMGGLNIGGASSSRGGLFGIENYNQNSYIYNTFIGCLFDDIYVNAGGTWGAVFGGNGHLTYTTTYNIYNCTFRFVRTLPNYACLFGGDRTYNTNTITFKNNIVSNEQSTNIFLVNRSSYDLLNVNWNLNFYNNCMYNFNTNGGDSDYNLDPKFIDPDNGNFRLQTSSPCLGAGTGVI